MVLEVALPCVDGLEVTRRIRADGIDVGVLFLTGRTSLAKIDATGPQLIRTIRLVGYALREPI